MGATGKGSRNSKPPTPATIRQDGKMYCPYVGSWIMKSGCEAVRMELFMNLSKDGKIIDKKERKKILRKYCEKCKGYSIE